MLQSEALATPHPAFGSSRHRWMDSRERMTLRRFFRPSFCAAVPAPHALLHMSGRFFIRARSRLPGRRADCSLSLGLPMVGSCSPTSLGTPAASSPVRRDRLIRGSGPGLP